MNRRDLIAGIGAAALAPNATWADAHDPGFLSAAQAPDGSSHLCGLGAGGQVLFHLPLPDRGHAAAAHPQRPEAVAFARRPGRFALILDCAAGRELARLVPPQNRHFYGHGTFSGDGRILFTTENDLDTLEGRIGIWDAARGYARIGDIPSGGIGPHDITRLPGSETLVVANGGIATHPDSGRTALNLATMRANLTYLTQGGDILDRVELSADLRQNSIRHLDVGADGLVAAGMQWAGPSGQHPPLVMLHRRGQGPVLLAAPDAEHRRLVGYVGSIAFLGGSSQIGATSPRGGVIQVFDTGRAAYVASADAADACGIAQSGAGTAIVTTGEGAILELAGGGATALAQGRWRWDNHLVRI